MESDILIVDDQAENLQILTNLLTEEGYLVRAANCGSIALQIIQQSPPDLILLYIRMPDMDGYEVCQHLKADEQTRAIPIIFLSVLEEIEDKLRAFQAGGVDFINKPFQVEEVLARVETHLKLRAAQKQLEQEITDSNQVEEALRTHQIELEMQNAELLRTQKHLEQIWEKYADLYNFAPVGYCTFDAQGIILEANLTAASLLGVKRDRLIKQRFYHWIIEEDRDKFFLHLRTLFDTKTRQTCQLRLVSEDGALCDVQLEAVVFEDLTDISNQCRTVISDITDRKRAEEALIKEKEFTDIALNSQLDTFFVFEPATGRAIHWNKAFADISGYTDEEIGLLQAPNSYYSPEDMEKAAVFIESVFREGKGRIELSLICKDGHRVPTEYEVSVLPDHQGKSTYFISIGRDITDRTDRKRAEDELNVALEKYKVLFESFPLGISITDKNGNIVEANRESVRLLGIPKEEHAKRTYDGKEWKIIRPDGTPMPAEEYASVKALQEQRLIENAEMGIVKEHNDVTWISVTAAPIPLEHYGVAIAYSDITDRKQSEDDLRRALKERTALIQEIHHRVKNNLQVVSSLLYLQAQKTSNAEARRILEESRHRITSMVIVHEQLYASDNLAEINMAEYLEKLAAYMYHACEINIHDIALRLKLDPFMLSIVRAVPCGLLVQELMSNAFRHGFPQGRKGKIFVTFQTADDTLTLSVRNTGVPFPDDVDIHATTSMGMDLIDAFTTQLRGTLELDRTEGTTFTITFPKN